MAVNGWQQLEGSTVACYRSDLVVAESLNLIARFAGASTAARIGKQILSSHIKILRSRHFLLAGFQLWPERP
jgi:hypothetical protein